MPINCDIIVSSNVLSPTWYRIIAWGVFGLFGKSSFWNCFSEDHSETVLRLLAKSDVSRSVSRNCYKFNTNIYFSENIYNSMEFKWYILTMGNHCNPIYRFSLVLSLQWRHNERDGVSNHQPHNHLLNHLFKAQIKENIKAPRHWPLWGDFTGDRWIPRTKGH